jgi:hypothetical protein
MKKTPKQTQENPEPPLPAPTSREDWKALGPEEQWTLFSRVEMDAIGWERRVRQLKDELARQVAASKAFADRIEREDQHRLRIENERSEDAWKLQNAARTLRRQIQDLGHSPLA